jgi:signal peptidase I
VGRGRLPKGKLLKTLFFVVMLLVAFLVVLFVTSISYRVPASAMEPTFHCARPGSGCEADHMDRVLVSRFTYRFRDPRRGDLAAFHAPGPAVVACGLIGDEDVVYLKRIVALPGERWREQDGYIYVNGTRLDEPYVTPDRRDQETIPERTVPNDEYVLLGDNRSSSCDSRRWGAVPRDDLIGPVYAVYWPPGRIGFK